MPITHFLRSGATPTAHAIAAATVEAVGLVDAAAVIIRCQPEITHCDDPNCQLCHDAVLGGPVIR